jgi:hypothetical protein
MRPAFNISSKLIRLSEYVDICASELGKLKLDPDTSAYLEKRMPLHLAALMGERPRLFENLSATNAGEGEPLPEKIRRLNGGAGHFGLWRDEADEVYVSGITLRTLTPYVAGSIARKMEGSLVEGVYATEAPFGLHEVFMQFNACAIRKAQDLRPDIALCERLNVAPQPKQLFSAA